MEYSAQFLGIKMYSLAGMFNDVQSKLSKYEPITDTK